MQTRRSLSVTTGRNALSWDMALPSDELSVGESSRRAKRAVARSIAGLAGRRARLA